MKKLTILFGLLGFLMSGYYATWQANLLSRGFSVNHIATLIAISVSCSFLFEVPSGVVADKLGHKKAVLLGFTMYVIGFFIPSISAHPLSLAATVIVVTIGDAIMEGAMDAWCSDVQRASSGKVSSHAFMGFDQAQRFGMIVGALVVPAVITVLGKATNGGWFIYALIAAAILIYAATIPTGAPLPGAHTTRKSGLLELRGHLGSKTLLMLLACSFIYGLSDGANQTAFWPRLKEIGVSAPIFLGFIQSGMSLSRMVGLHFWKRSRVVESVRLPAIALIGSSLFFVLFAVSSNPIMALPIWFLRIMILSAFFSAQRGLIQKIYGHSKWRATITSAVATTCQLGTIALTSGIGLFGNISVSTICYLGGALSLIAGLMFLNFRPGLHDELPT